MHESEIVARLCRIYKCTPDKLVDLAQKSRLMDICLLDKLEDRLWHQEDNTWWKRVGDSLKSADKPFNWMENKIMFGLAYHNHYDSIMEASFATNAGISGEGWYKANDGDTMLVLSNSKGGFDVYVWNGTDPRPEMKRALGLKENT